MQFTIITLVFAPVKKIQFAGFPYQSGVVDGDDEVKERLQSGAVSRGVLLNLNKSERKLAAALQSLSAFHFLNMKSIQ